MMSSRNKVKSIIITGAGFSFPAGIPTQRELLYNMEIFQPNALQPGSLKFMEAKEKVNRYLKTIFLQNTSEDCPKELLLYKLSNIQLEDIYTMLDQAIYKGDVIPPFSEDKLIEIRSALDNCIIYYLNYIQTNLSSEKRGIYNNLYCKLMKNYGNDWLVVSTNWDTVWDEILLSIHKDKNFDINYGPNIYGIEPDGRAKIIEPNWFSPRLLKLHGSFNWLTCPQCHTIFIWPKEFGVRNIFDPICCPRCSYKSDDVIEPYLRPLFLTPSLIKNIKNPTLELIWDEAFCALSSAEQVIFIGYSLPLADHDLRYLLRRSISKKTKVKVILHEKDRLIKNENFFISPEFRYKSLLDLSDNDFYYDGFESFFSLEVSE